MGEWQAWHPTVSRQSRSTDITDAFGPGTRWSAGPESYIDEVVAASPVFRVPTGPPARSPSAPRADGSARRLEARPGPAVPPAPFTLVARVCRERSCPAAVPGHRGRGCVTGVPGAVGPARPLAVRATSRWLGGRLEARPGPAVPPEPFTLVARVCRERSGPNVADPRPRR